EFVWRVTPPGDFQHRVLDPRTPHEAAIDQLWVEDAPLWIKPSASLITPEAHPVDRCLPPAHLGRCPPLLPHALEAALGMKHVQDAGPPRRQMRPDTPEQPINVAIRFQ